MGRVGEVMYRYLHGCRVANGCGMLRVAEKRPPDLNPFTLMNVGEHPETTMFASDRLRKNLSRF